MKYVVMLGDGMADRPIPSLGNRTPLQAAYKPYMDYVAAHGACGMTHMVPKGMPPQSDTANLAVMATTPKFTIVAARLWKRSAWGWNSRPRI